MPRYLIATLLLLSLAAHACDAGHPPRPKGPRPEGPNALETQRSWAPQAEPGWVVRNKRYPLRMSVFVARSG